VKYTELFARDCGECEAPDDLHFCADMRMVEHTIRSLSVPSAGKEGDAAAVAVFRVDGTGTEWDR
jgi:hypothetical protein